MRLYLYRYGCMGKPPYTFLFKTILWARAFRTHQTPLFQGPHRLLFIALRQLRLQKRLAKQKVLIQTSNESNTF